MDFVIDIDICSVCFVGVQRREEMSGCKCPRGDIRLEKCPGDVLNPDFKTAEAKSAI